MSNERYVFLKQIGEGGQGKVYLCNDQMSNNYVCIKKVPQPALSEKFGVMMLKRVNHPGFVKTLNTFEDEYYYYHVMSYIEGIPLSNLKNGVSLKTTKRIGIELLKMVQELSSFHTTFNDIKPDNIILEKDGHIRLIDVGAVLKEGDLYSKRYGSVYFASNEYLNKKACDWKSDVYSVAKTLLYVCKRKDLLLHFWIKKATRVNVDTRFKTIDEAVSCLKFDGIKLSTYILCVCIFLSLGFVTKVYFRNQALSNKDIISLLCINSFDQKGYELLENSQENYMFIVSINGFRKMNDDLKEKWVNYIQKENQKWAWEIQKRWYQYSKYKYRLKVDETFLNKYTSKSDVEYYLQYLFYHQKTELYLQAYKKIERMKNVDEWWLVELAYRMKDLKRLNELYKTNQGDDIKAACLYYLFLLGDYDQQLLVRALNLLDYKKYSNIYYHIQKELNQWRDKE